MGLAEQAVDKFVDLCRVPFDGYDDNGATKRAYARLGRQVARALAAAIGEPGADIRWNKAGIAVAGDVTMHGDRIAVYFTGGVQFFGEPAQFFYRRVDSRRDHHGYGNRWLPYTSLCGLVDNVDECAAVVSMRAALAAPVGRRI